LYTNDCCGHDGRKKSLYIKNYVLFSCQKISCLVVGIRPLKKTRNAIYKRISHHKKGHRANEWGIRFVDSLSVLRKHSISHRFFWLVSKLVVDPLVSAPPVATARRFAKKEKRKSGSRSPERIWDICYFEKIYIANRREKKIFDGNG
jgi:hypothetical protein